MSDLNTFLQQSRLYFQMVKEKAKRDKEKRDKAKQDKLDQEKEIKERIETELNKE